MGPRHGRRRAAFRSLVGSALAALWVLAGGMPSASATAPGGWAAEHVANADRVDALTASPARPRLDDTMGQPGNLVLTQVTPSVAGPTTPVTVTGTIRSVDGATFANPTVRVVRGRASVTTQDALDSWVAAGDPTTGTEIGRVAIPGTVAPATSVGFSITIPADALRLNRAFGAVPIAIEIRSDDDITRGVIRTFVGWHRAPEYTPISLATVVPITLDPDPHLQSLDPALRAQAWIAAVGTTSRLARIVAAAGRAGTPISYAVDPSILGPLKVAGPSGAQAGVSADLLAPTPTPLQPPPQTPASPPTQTPAQTPAQSPGPPGSAVAGATTGPATSSAAGPTTPATPTTPTTPATPIPDILTAPTELDARAGFLAALTAATAGHAVYALPESDLDLAALRPGDTGSAIVGQALMPSSRLAAALPAAGSDASLRTLPRLAWPVDGVLGDGLDERLRTAYRSGPDLLLVSATASRTGDLTPDAAARTGAGTSVARWDDRLSAVAASAANPILTAEAIQRFTAQSAVLLAERPSIRRDAVIALPRGLDPDVASMTRFFQEVRSIPWLTPVGLDTVAAHAAVSTTSVTPTTPAPAPATAPATTPAMTPGAGGAWPTPDPTPLTEGVLPSITERQAALLAYRQVQPPTVGPVSVTDRWLDTAVTLTSARWRANPGAFRELRQGLDVEVAAVSAGLGIVSQTANFLADEGVLLITVANDLDLPVADVTVHLAPTNARMAVAQPIAPISIAARSKATVPVRMVALAQGLVPIDAWLTAPDGSRVGSSTTIQVRAAPPGAWLYVAAGAVLLALLLFGAWRSLRRPSRVPDSVVLDPVEVLAEPPFEPDPPVAPPRQDGRS